MKLSDAHRWVGFDVESTGRIEQQQALMPWSPHGDLISYAFAYRKKNQRITSKATVSINTLREFLIKMVATKRPVVGWNVAFDAAWCIAKGHGDLVKQINWIDGMLLWRHLERYPESDKNQAGRKKYGLKDAVTEFMPEMSGYDAGIDWQPNQQADKELLKYNRRDAMYTLELAQRFAHWLIEGNPRAFDLCMLECQCIPLVAEHYVHGLVVDVDKATKLRKQLDIKQAELGEELATYGLTDKVLASPAQLSAKLYDEWQLPVYARTPKGAPSTNKEALHELALEDERMEKVRDYREAGNLRTKFVDKLLESAEYNGDGTTHPTMNMASTYTGRATFSSSVGRNKEKRQTGFAIHQMKRATEYRQLIKPPPGFTLVEWDAAGQEYRWMAIVSGDKTMLRLCKPGEDPHSSMAADMSDMEYRELMHAAKDHDHGRYVEAAKLRQSGKVGNLSCQYRIGVESLLRTARVNHGMPWSEGMAYKVYTTYHKKYPGVKKYWKRQIDQCKKRGYVRTLAGRTIHLPRWNRERSWMLESASVNFPVQGIGADQKYLAMANLRPVLDKYGGRFFFELHDGIYAVFPDDVALDAAYEGKNVLDDLPYQEAWGFTPPIPLPFDIKIGPNWGDMTEL